MYRQYLVSYRGQWCEVVQHSGWHENLQNLFTRTAIREEPLSDLQKRMEDFTSYHPTALPQSALPLGKRELLHGRGHYRGTLEQGLRYAT